MAKVKIEGNASGTGTFTIAAPNSNSDRTLTLPDEAGTVLTNDTASNVNFKGGDISFYEDTGTTAKFFWDASAEALGIGTTTTGTSSSIVFDSSLQNNIRFNNGGTFKGYIGVAGAANNIFTGAVADELALRSSSAIAFAAGNARSMTIDSSGNLLVGTTTSRTGSDSLSFESANSLIWFQKNGTATQSQVIFQRNTTGTPVIVGSIQTSGTSTSYNTSSDYRLKEDWQPMSGSIDRLKALNPVNFAWKVDGSRVDGFLAHEAQQVVPEAVSGEKDAVEAIGNVTDAEGTVVQENVLEPAELAEGQTWTKTEDRPVYQGIDQAKLVPLLTAALQEAVSKIEALETRIAALEA